MSLLMRFLLWPLLLAGQLLAVSLLAWHLLAHVNFGYPLAYKLLNIESHIQLYGPQNRHKAHFEQTTPAEHKALFADITHAVQSSGEGLADIRYRLPDGNSEPLMREPEIIHLQDVANLIDIFYQAGLIGLGIWLVMLVIARWQGATLPPPIHIASGFLAVILVISSVVIVIGPTRVFYWLHEWIFPDDHEWFFFYQDSLMTTLMKAPDLFGVISLWLLIVLLLFWGGSLWLMGRWLKVVRPTYISTSERMTEKLQSGHKKGGSKRSAKGGNRQN